MKQGSFEALNMFLHIDGFSVTVVFRNKAQHALKLEVIMSINKRLNRNLYQILVRNIDK